MDLSIYLSIYLPIYLSICLETSSVFELDNIKNAAILWDFLNFWAWQRRKRRNSARLPQFSKLRTSKTKQFCKTSFKNGKWNPELTASYQCVLRCFHSTCLKYLSKNLETPQNILRNLEPSKFSEETSKLPKKASEFSEDPHPQRILILRRSSKFSENPQNFLMVLILNFF